MDSRDVDAALVAGEDVLHVWNHQAGQLVGEQVGGEL